jgi:hypothetical protein
MKEYEITSERLKSIDTFGLFFLTIPLNKKGVFASFVALGSS